MLGLLGLPYGYMAIFWTGCLVATCKGDGDMVFFTFPAIAALPFAMLIIGGLIMLSGAGTVVGVAEALRCAHQS